MGFCIRLLVLDGSKTCSLSVLLIFPSSHFSVLSFYSRLLSGLSPPRHINLSRFYGVSSIALVYVAHPVTSGVCGRWIYSLMDLCKYATIMDLVNYIEQCKTLFWKRPRCKESGLMEVQSHGHRRYPISILLVLTLLVGLL